MRQWIVETMERFNARTSKIIQPNTRTNPTTLNLFKSGDTGKRSKDCERTKNFVESYKRTARIVAIVGFANLIGCRVSGTIGGTTDLERKHDVSVSITFADGG